MVACLFMTFIDAHHSAIWSVKSYWRCFSYMYKKSQLAKKNLFELEFLLGMRRAKSMKLPKKKYNSKYWDLFW